MNLGVYIDADNISHLECEQIINYGNSIGNVILKKVYGDWTKTEMKNWFDKVFDYGMESIQIFRKKENKNSTDICMITDMIFDAHQLKSLNTIILASNDSDFSYVCNKLKYIGINVIVMSYSKSLLCNYSSNYIIFNKNNHIDEELPLNMFNKIIFKYSDLPTSEKKLVEDKYIVKYKKRKYVVNSDIFDRSIKKLKKNKKKTLEKYDEIFKVIPYDDFIKIIDI